MSPDVYTLTDEAYIFGNDVLSSTDQAKLDATQSGCTVDLRDLTDGADKTQQTADLTYHSASGNYTLEISDIASVLTEGNSYTGKIAKAGMLDIEISFVIDNGYIEDIKGTVDSIENIVTDIQKVTRRFRESNRDSSSINAVKSLVQSVLSKAKSLESAVKGIERKTKEIASQRRSKNGS